MCLDHVCGRRKLGDHAGTSHKHYIPLNKVALNRQRTGELLEERGAFAKSSECFAISSHLFAA